ncbi:sporulation protein YunB [Desulfofundulus thermosubterraneus]|uniref:Sporulation protein YunB n=1 Tax=Desulfofundulus thermosubterraneus DSM 16057 TaxID=1121432 RepID=A0A1M6F5B8_9FIRM|nr:sporulation protein YunB [Desulfofundulus thermosubterraneus]SHI92789.1 sporulation protein YunB [Desulfofundulus thermosubterraneus DSM 16057]
MFRRRRNYRAFVALTMFFFLLLGMFLWVDRVLQPTIFKIAETRAIQMATEAINRAVQRKVFDSNLQYQDFVQVHKDNQGHIVLMQANTLKINQFAADVTLMVQSALQQLSRESLRIPLGQITGTQLLAGYGPGIPVGIVPVGSVRVRVDDRFEQAGINQTRHRIYLDFNAEVRIVVPPRSATAQVATRVPLVESIIVGQVPGTFVNISGGLLSGQIVGNNP